MDGERERGSYRYSERDRDREIIMKNLADEEEKAGIYTFTGYLLTRSYKCRKKKEITSIVIITMRTCKAQIQSKTVLSTVR